jgi:SAM-dependent methyltransferase
MTRTTPQQTEVQAHYRELASEYGVRANPTCNQAYRRLVERVLRGCRRVLELGSGSTDLLDRLGSPVSVASDLSLDMLLMRKDGNAVHRVIASGERLPFRNFSFDGVFLINVLEHVVGVESVLHEITRVLDQGGLMLAVTPNGNWEMLLDLAERWKLKIPEGPHAFLTTRSLRSAVQACLEVMEHRTFLTLPAGPLAVVDLLDRISLCSVRGAGFFQYIVARKQTIDGLTSHSVIDRLPIETQAPSLG